MTATTLSAPAAPDRRRTSRLALGLVALGALLVVVCILSIILGSRDITLGTIWQAMWAFDPSSASETVVREMRLPRTLLGVTVGAALGAGGTILQGVTRNPLADPGILGVNAGAAAFIVVAIALLGAHALSTYIWLAFLGAGVAIVTVYGVASLGREGATPVKLALAGVAMTAGLTSITTAVVMTNRDALEELRGWQVGALAGRYMPVVWQTVPFIIAALVVALAMGRTLNGLALGEDVARSLGQNLRRTRFAMFATVAVLCGAATAACGPIVFVGLVVPHVARMVCGPDYRWILPYSMLIAPVVLLAADIVGRLVMSPAELQVGVVVGILGAPFFVFLVRYRNLSEL